MSKENIKGEWFPKAKSKHRVTMIALEHKGTVPELCGGSNP